VRHHIATAEPVGSKALVEEYNSVSAQLAIRNELEKGYSTNPIPAGRVPLRFWLPIYVDQLITPSDILTPLGAYQERLRWEDWSLEVLQGAAQILATVSGCITLITMPHNTARLRHLQLVQLDPGRVMIVVTDAYETVGADGVA